MRTALLRLPQIPPGKQSSLNAPRQQRLATAVAPNENKQRRVEVKAAERQAAEAAAAEIEIATCHKEGQNRIARGD